MKRFAILIGLVAILLGIMVTVSHDSAAAEQQVASREFYLVYSDNYDDGGGADLFITSYNSTYGTVKIPGIDFEHNFTVMADTITTVSLPLAAEVQGSDQIDDLGIYISANDDITAYLLNPGNPVYTNDAYVGLPVASLDTEYIVMAWPDTLPARAPNENGQSELAVVSPFNDVAVTITPSITTGSRTAGVAYTIKLNQFQTYTLQSDNAFEDLTGTVIKSSKPVAVFAGNRCADIPVGYGYCDHLIEQLTPTSAWGDNFVTMPLAARANGDYIRILAATNGTTVNVQGIILPAAVKAPSRRPDASGATHGVGDENTAFPLLASAPRLSNATYQLDRGQFVEFRTTDRTQITADKPVLVGQYGTGSNFGGNPGDPLFMLIPPSQQFLSKYTFLTPTGYATNYVNIIVPTESNSSVMLDGKPVAAVLFQPIGNGAYEGAAVRVDTGSHTISGAKPFGIYVYGFGRDVSYGYPGGLDAKVINPPPADNTPIIIIPGLAGTRLGNDDGEIWLDLQRLVDDAVNHGGFPGNAYFDALRLNEDGTGPLRPDDEAYTSVKTGEVLTKIDETIDIPDWLPGVPNELDVDVVFYQALIDHFEAQGYRLNEDLFLFPYDWRRDLRETTIQLDALINRVRDGGQVNIVAHSMGGLVTRQYILDAGRAAKVGSVAILGTPFLGAPYAFKAIYLGDDFGINATAHDKGIPGSMWLVNEGRVRELAQNFPGVYQILPSKRFFDVYENGYIVEDRDVDGNGAAGGDLKSYEATKTFLNALLNDRLIPKAEAFHSSAFDGFASGTNGVEVCLFVGAGQATRERIRFWETTTFKFFKQQHSAWFYSTGDGTVLLHSVDLKDDDSDFQGPAHVFYAKADHQGLVTNFDVQQQVSQCFKGNFNPVNDKISLFPNAWPVQGEWIEVNSPVELHIYDSLGNHLGPSLEEEIDGRVIEYGIPNAQYNVLGHGKSAFVPAGIDYTVVLIGLDEGTFDLRLRSVAENEIQQTVIYKEVGVLPDSVAHVGLESGSSYRLEMDLDADGTTDYTVPPTQILDPEESLDVEPPQSTITLEGQKDPLGFYQGLVTVTITAQDNPGGSGVDKILYSTDGGATVQTYTAPFTVHVDDVQIIDVKAIDRAGNEQATLTSARLTPYFLHLPSIIR